MCRVFAKPVWWSLLLLLAGVAGPIAQAKDGRRQGLPRFLDRVGNQHFDLGRAKGLKYGLEVELLPANSNPAFVTGRSRKFSNVIMEDS